MAIIKFNPYREFNMLQDEMNRLFNSFARGSDLQTLAEGTWAPVVDIYENKDEIMIDAEIPGVSQEDIQVSITNNILTIKGEKKQHKEVKEENFHRVERSYGMFSRSFSLPASVKSDMVKATFKDGVLRISIQKQDEVQTNNFPIEVK